MAASGMHTDDRHLVIFVEGSISILWYTSTTRGLVHFRVVSYIDVRAMYIEILHILSDRLDNV